MVHPLEMGWRHLLFENWPVDPVSAPADTVACYSPGLDVLAGPSTRAPPEAEA